MNLKQAAIFHLAAAIGILAFAPRLFAGDEADLKKAQNLVCKKAATVRAVSATLKMKGTMRAADSNDHSVQRDCEYERSAAVLAARQTAVASKSGTTSGKKSKQTKKGPRKAKAPATADTPSADVWLWNFQWEPRRFETACAKMQSLSPETGIEAAVYDGKLLYVLLAAATDGPVAQSAVKYSLVSSGPAAVAKMLDDLCRDFGLMESPLPPDILVPTPEMFESWSKRWKVSLKPEIKIGRDRAIVIQRTQDFGDKLVETYYYSKKNGVLQGMERRTAAGQTHFSLKVENQKINQKVPFTRFEFKPPPGIEVMDGATGTTKS